MWVDVNLTLGITLIYSVQKKVKPSTFSYVLLLEKLF